MKKLIDFIGNAIVKLIEWSAMVIILPLTIVCAIIVGFIQKLCGVRYQTFTKVYEGLGEMTSSGTSEKKCTQWTKDIELGDWKNAKLVATRDILENKQYLSMVSSEYRKVQQNISDIVAYIKNGDVYKNILDKEGIDILAANDKVTVELNIDEEGDLDPWVALSYDADHYYVSQLIKNGDMIGFSVIESSES